MSLLLCLFSPPYTHTCTLINKSAIQDHEASNSSLSLLPPSPFLFLSAAAHGLICMVSRATPFSLRIAIGLSGGVDSAVTALLLHRCVRTEADVAALRCFGTAYASPPAPETLQSAVAAEASLLSLLPSHVQHQIREDLSQQTDGSVTHDAAVEYYPFHMRNWHDDDAANGWCARSLSDYDDAQRVAWALRLLPRTSALPVLDFAETYSRECFQRMLDAYAAGCTLNVDVLCNSRIKFGAVAEALKVVQASSHVSLDESTAAATAAETTPRKTLLATGHYARTWRMPVALPRATGQQAPALLVQPCSAGHDLNDQTHFLSRVPPSALAGALFPLGHLFTSKAEVRSLAHHAFSANRDIAHLAQKPTSTGICFVNPPSSLPPDSKRGRTTTAAEGHKKRAVSSSPSCKTRFASFLNQFLPPPPPPSPPPSPTSASRSLSLSPVCTVFRDVSADIPKELVVNDDVFRALRTDYPSYLPAFAVTLGQRLRLADTHVDGTVKKAPVKTFYVARKVCLPAPLTTNEDAHAVRLLAEVHVVDRWDHPLLFTTCIKAASLRWWWLPPAALNAPVLSRSCLCALRHQMAPQPATIRWTTADEEASSGGEDGVRVRHCTVEFDTPVRAPVAGQAVVLYASLTEVQRAFAAPPGTTVQRQGLCALSSCIAAADALAVIGSGWVDVGEEKSR